MSISNELSAGTDKMVLSITVSKFLTFDQLDSLPLGSLANTLHQYFVKLSRPEKSNSLSANCSSKTIDEKNSSEEICNLYPVAPVTSLQFTLLSIAIASSPK